MFSHWDWLKGSLTVKGAIATGVGILCDPNVAALLPSSWARGIAVIGGVATVIGLRRALPAPPGGQVFALPANAPPQAVFTDDRGLSPDELAAMKAAGEAAFPKKSGIGGPLTP